MKVFKNTKTKMAYLLLLTSIVLLQGSTHQDALDNAYMVHEFGNLEFAPAEGTALSEAVALRTVLSKLLKELEISTILDAGCGNAYWSSHVSLDDCDYIGVDIVEELISLNNNKYGSNKRTFQVLDIINDSLPAVDLIICRNVLTYFPLKDIFKTLCNFRKTGARYLIVTSFMRDIDRNIDGVRDNWRILNLQRPPFNFPKPYRIIMDDCTAKGDTYCDKALFVWKLEDLFDENGPLSDTDYDCNTNSVKLVVDFDQSFGLDGDERKDSFIDSLAHAPTYFQLWRLEMEPNTHLEVYRRLKRLYEKNAGNMNEGSFYKIPPTIHQIWIQGEPPYSYSLWQKTWKEKRSGWNYILWTDKSIRALPLVNRDLYEQETNPGAKSSLARIEILNLFGGFYVDCDSECVRPELLERLLKSYTFVGGIAPVSDGVIYLNSAAIGAVAGHPILQDYLFTIKKWVLGADINYYKQKGVTLTGPVPFTRSVLRGIDQSGYVDIALPPTFFYALSIIDSLQLSETEVLRKIPELKKKPECVSIDHWKGGWVNYNEAQYDREHSIEEFSYKQSPSLTGSHLPVYMRQPFDSPSPWVTSREVLLQQLPKNAVIAEVGVQAGDFAAAILHYTNPSKLYLIDCWQEQTQEEYPAVSSNVKQQRHDELYHYVKKRFEGDARVEIIKGFSPEAADLFDDDFFDWVYVDANHIYQAVRDDLMAWSKKVKKGGFICGHDYTNKAKVSIGVVPAVNEFLQYHDATLTFLTTDHWASYGMQKKWDTIKKK